MLKTAITTVSDNQNEGEATTTSCLARAEKLGYVAVNKDLTIHYVSPEFYDILGVDRSAIIVGTSLADIIGKIGLNDAKSGISFDVANLLDLVNEAVSTGQASRGGNGCCQCRVLVTEL